MRRSALTRCRARPALQLPPLLVACAALLAAGAARAEEARAAAGAPAAATDDGWNPSMGRVPGHPPAGAPADVALWQSLVDEHSDVLTSRARATRMLWKLHDRRHDQELATAASAATGADAARLLELRQKLLSAWGKAHATLTRQWPVDPRFGCRAERIDLEAALDGSYPQLGTVRDQAKECLGRMSLAARAMKGADDELAQVVDEAERELALRRVQVAAAPAGSGAATPRPPSAAEER